MAEIDFLNTGLEKRYSNSKIVSVILQQAIEGDVANVHIEPVPEGTQVRYRLKNALYSSLTLPVGLHDSLVSWIKILANLKLDETSRPQNGYFRIKFENRAVEFQVSTLPLLNKEKIVLHILDTAKALKDLESLGFSYSNLEIIQKHIKSPHGIYLVTGPRSSGKSTTLCTILNILNQEKVNIATLEDSVEFSLPRVLQAPIRPEAGLTFAAGLRSLLRQNIDIIMLSEIRDNETAELVVQAALTGRKILSTLSTKTVLRTIARLIDMGIEPFLIASSLKMVISQRLVGKLCQHCKIEKELPLQLLPEVIAEITKIPKEFLSRDIDWPIMNNTNLTITDWQKFLRFFSAKGCSHCKQTGYSGRLVIAEVMEMTNSLKQSIMIDQSNSLDLIKQELIHQGMLTMKQDGIIKALRGITSIEEVWRATRQ